MKFPINSKFQEKFSEIPGIQFYPYVGQDYGIENKRILVFAHNIPVSSEKYEKDLERTDDPNHFAEQMVGYVYDQQNWARAFRNFIKGSLGLKKNYSRKSPSEITDKIDEFVEKIAFVNFINGLVKSNGQINAKGSKEDIERSKRINNEILKILEPTHCVCWGKDVYGYLLTLDDFELIEEKKVKKKGFGYALIKNKNNSHRIHVLKAHHPSMPGFSQLKDKTHKIFEWFYGLE